MTALRGDVAHLFLALKAAESRHQHELAGVIIDAAHHQTQVLVHSSADSSMHVCTSAGIYTKRFIQQAVVAILVIVTCDMMG